MPKTEDSLLRWMRPEEYYDLLRSQRKIEGILGRGGYSKKTISGRIQFELWNVCERKSAACHYEQLRAREYLARHPELAGQRDGEWVFLTLAPPQLRVPPEALHTVDPERTLRYWHRGVARLKKEGLSIRGICVFEVNHCKPLKGEDFIEPHLHAAIHGATKEQVKRAFPVRKLSRTTIRRRPIKVLPVYDLAGLLNYFTKFEPEKKVEHLGRAKWATNDLRGRQEAKWHEFMSGFQTWELLKFEGINGRDLRRASKAELQVPRRNRPREGPSNSKRRR